MKLAIGDGDIGAMRYSDALNVILRVSIEAAVYVYIVEMYVLRVRNTPRIVTGFTGI